MRADTRPSGRGPGLQGSFLVPLSPLPSIQTTGEPRLAQGWRGRRSPPPARGPRASTTGMKGVEPATPSVSTSVVSPRPSLRWWAPPGSSPETERLLTAVGVFTERPTSLRAGSTPLPRSLDTPSLQPQTSLTSPLPAPALRTPHTVQESGSPTLRSSASLPAPPSFVSLSTPFVPPSRTRARARGLAPRGGLGGPQVGRP